jgi:hypothetical protein
LKLTREEPISNFGFNFNLRRYNLKLSDIKLVLAGAGVSAEFSGGALVCAGGAVCVRKAGAYLRPLFSSTSALFVDY